MYSVMKASAGIPGTLFRSDTLGGNSNPDASDPWLFTDPGAKRMYLHQGRLALLERDIRKVLMSDNQWNWDELAFKRELQRLVFCGAIAPQHAFGHLSPHPTIYLTIEESSIQIAGERYYLEIGDQIVFEPWLARLYYPAVAGPFRIGRFDITRNYRLSEEAFPQVKYLSEKDFGCLRQIAFTAKHKRN